MSTHRPMEGIRILDLADHTFVPAASAVLSDWGAEVIKIEHITRGDAARGLASTGMAIFAGDVSPILEHANRGKLSLALDLNQDEGRDILYQLAAISDVFLTNKMPSVREKLKTDIDDIRAAQPEHHLRVGARLRRARSRPPTPAATTRSRYWYRGTSGMSAKAPDATTVPGMPAPAYGDTIGAMTIAGGISAALFHRERTGEADVVDVSLMNTGMWAMGAGIAVSLLAGMPWHELAAHTVGQITNPLVQVYETKDGRFLSLCMLQGHYYWPEACERFGIPQYIDDPRFATNELLHRERAGRRGARRRGDQAEDARGVEGAAAGDEGPVGAGAGHHRGRRPTRRPSPTATCRRSHSKGGTPFTLVSTPVQFNGAPAPTSRAPEFNEHGDEILTEKLGLDWDTIVDLKVKGVVG